jgi:hypothetical protein
MLSFKCLLTRQQTQSASSPETAAVANQSIYAQAVKLHAVILAQRGRFPQLVALTPE